MLDLDQESGFVEGNISYEIESSSTRNKSKLSEDKDVLGNEKELEEKTTFLGNCSTCVGNALYEIVSLPTKSVEEF